MDLFNEVETLQEELLQKHRKEKKELQSKIQVLKKTATKGDKKKKKEVQEEINRLEAELLKKHEEELSHVENKLCKVEKEKEMVDAIQDVSLNEVKAPSKVSKAQKRRDKRATEQKEREQRIMEQELENETGLRHVETEKIKEVLKKKGLMLFEITPDGNCLYSAIHHQMKEKANVNFGVKELRFETSNHIRQKESDYLPFLSNPNTGEMLTPEEFSEYCNNIANTTHWGGQVELRALSHVVKRPITVIQADGPPLLMGEEYNNSEGLTISYHRHMYKLGEHYNSVQLYADDGLSLS